MSDYRYPTKEDLSANILIDGYKILSSKEFTKKNAAILGKHVYILQGVLQGELLGEPDSFGSHIEIEPSQSILENANFKKFVEECENLVMVNKRFGGEGNIVGDSPDAEMDPAIIIMFVEIAMKVIEMLRKRRKN
jgi:hypothetical protein